MYTGLKHLTLFICPPYLPQTYDFSCCTAASILKKKDKTTIYPAPSSSWVVFSRFLSTKKEHQHHNPGRRSQIFRPLDGRPAVCIHHVAWPRRFKESPDVGNVGNVVFGQPNSYLCFCCLMCVQNMEMNQLHPICLSVLCWKAKTAWLFTGFFTRRFDQQTSHLDVMPMSRSRRVTFCREQIQNSLDGQTDGHLGVCLCLFVFLAVRLGVFCVFFKSLWTAQKSWKNDPWLVTFGQQVYFFDRLCNCQLML